MALRIWTLSAALVGLLLCVDRASAANAYPVDTDPNQDGLNFGGTDVFQFGAYTVDAGAQLNGNDVALYGQNFMGACCHGAGFSVPVSNGENGLNESLDGTNNEVVNTDIPNATPANGVFAAIGNASGRLQNGNVLRYSAWFRADPANPIAAAPQIEPVLKFEFWKEALSIGADTNGGQIQPTFGDKVFDQEQHGGALGIPAVDKAQWVDIDANGAAIDGAAAAEGRLSTISSGAWTLVETTYTVNDADWLGIADDIYTVSDIEEIRGVMFMGDFAGTNLTGDGNGGNLLVDNILFEVFANAAAVTANTNPNPTLSEMVGLDGDYNNDGAVDAADYTVWRDNLGGNSSALNGNGTGAATVVQADYDHWKTNFGSTAFGGGIAAAGVPEPATLTLGLLALGLAGRLRRRVA